MTDKIKLAAEYLSYFIVANGRPAEITSAEGLKNYFNDFIAYDLQMSVEDVQSSEVIQHAIKSGMEQAREKLLAAHSAQSDALTVAS